MSSFAQPVNVVSWCHHVIQIMYVCRDCVLLATDEEGKALEFFNSDIFGHGCVGSYKDSEEVYGSNICYIKGIKFEANEAYMGGIVVTPVLSLQ